MVVLNEPVLSPVHTDNTPIGIYLLKLGKFWKVSAPGTDNKRVVVWRMEQRRYVPVFIEVQAPIKVDTDKV